MNLYEPMVMATAANSTARRVAVAVPDDFVARQAP